MEVITRHVYDNLKMIEHSPSVQMQDVPGDLIADSEDRAAAMDDAADPDVRITQADEDRKVEPPNEFYNGDEDQDRPETDQSLP